MKELDRTKPPKRPKAGGKSSAATESGRVAGQLGGLYVREGTKSAAQKGKSKAKRPEHD